MSQPRSRAGSQRPLVRRSRPRSTPGAAAPASDHEPTPARSSVPVSVLKVAGSVLAPATLITALLYYFGLLHAFWFFGTFGVDYTVFDLTTQDYLFRSADGLFVPVTVVAGVGLVLIWGYRLLPARPDSSWRTAAAPAAIAVLAGLGVVLIGTAVVGIVAPPLLYRYLALPGLALSIGTLALLAASRLYRWRRQQTGRAAPTREPTALLATEWTAVFLLVSVGLFWAAGDYSTAVGTRRGNQVLESLPDLPHATVYSNQRLNLTSAGVREVRCPGDTGEVYRYDRLHLIVHAGGQYLFLPTEFDTYGQAIVLPETSDLRLAFSAPGPAPSGSC